MKYFYEKISLKEYCEKENINYKTLLTNIIRLRKKEQYKKLSNEELIKEAIAKIGKTKYMYEGITLKEYCKKNNLSYNNLIRNIRKLRKQYKSHSETELIKMILNKDNNANQKLSLKKYCAENNLSYSVIANRIERLKKNEKYKDYSNEKLLNEALNYQKRSKYMIDNSTLFEYCKKNNLSYTTVKSRMEILKNKPKYKNYSMEDIIKVSVKGTLWNKYFYNGISIEKYCEDNNILKATLTRRIYRFRKLYPEYSSDEIVKLAVEYKPECKYYYDKKLMDYCNEINFNYSYVIHRLNKLKKRKEYQGYTNEELVDKIIDTYNENRQKEKIFNILDNGINNEDELKEVCKYFKVSMYNVKKIALKDKDMSKSFNFIYYFGDEKDEDGNITISNKRIVEVKKLVNKVKSADNSAINEFTLLELVGLYKAKLFDTRELILKKRNRYIYGDIFKICKRFSVKANFNNEEDFANEMRLFYLTNIEKINSNVEEKIGSFLTKTTRGNFMNYLKYYISNNQEKLILNTTFREDDNEDLIDTFESKETGFERLFEDDNFDYLLKKLTIFEKNFILLRFKKNYSYDELAKYCDVSKEKIIKKEKSILEKLRRDETICKMVKKNY